MNDKHIRIAKGEARVWNCIVTTDGSPQDLTGCSLSFTVKKKLSYTDSQALFQCYLGSGIAITGTTSGQFQLTVSTLSTSQVVKSDNNWAGFFDHRIKLSNGNVKVLEQGEFVVTPSVTDTVR
jgi:hypothetical protein